jgi:hypothetical protein
MRKYIAPASQKHLWPGPQATILPTHRFRQDAIARGQTCAPQLANAALQQNHRIAENPA